jgi:parvulin-like peptidyl-prolyl isomerase
MVIARTLLAVSLASVFVGCADRNAPVGTPIERVWESPAPATPATPPAVAATSQPASAPAGVATSLPADDVLAVVNGVAISRRQVDRELLEAYGLDLIEQHVLLAAARQRLTEMGLSVTKADITAAHEDALKRLASPLGGDEQLLDRAAAERLLDEFLVAKNISRTQWQRRMEQQACLKAIAAVEVAKMPISESMLREEYALEYGERVQIRHIQVSSLEAVSRVRAQLAAGKDFELVARQLSENQITAARGGLMPPFTRNDTAVPPLVREAAFTLEPSQVSPAINESTWFHILRLERKFPASTVGFENVDQQALTAQLRDRLTRQRMEVLERELFKSAAVDIRDPGLNKQFREQHRRTKQ